MQKTKNISVEKKGQKEGAIIKEKTKIFEVFDGNTYFATHNWISYISYGSSPKNPFSKNWRAEKEGTKATLFFSESSEKKNLQNSES